MQTNAKMVGFQQFQHGKAVENLGIFYFTDSKEANIHSV
jgi:hypothetical protein